MSTIKQMKAFIMVADLKSFTGAAELMFMTQPAVSSQIKALEEDIGLAMIHRNDKKVELTEAGKEFYREAKSVLVAYERAMEVMDEFRGLKRGRLAVGASTIPGEYLLPKYIGAFRRQYPGIQVALTVSDTEAVLDLLTGRKIDLAVVGAKNQRHGVEFLPFVEDELVLIAAAGKEIPPILHCRELAELEFVVREKGSGTQMAVRQVMATCGLQEKDLAITMELGSTQAVLTAVAADLGVGFVSLWAAENAIKAGAVQKIIVQDLDLRRELYLATVEESYTTHARDTFRSFLLAPLPEK